MSEDKCRAVCQEIRDAFDYFSEWDLPLGFEDRLNEALGLPPRTAKAVEAIFLEKVARYLPSGIEKTHDDGVNIAYRSRYQGAVLDVVINGLEFSANLKYKTWDGIWTEVDTDRVDECAWVLSMFESFICTKKKKPSAKAKKTNVLANTGS